MTATLLAAVAPPASPVLLALGFALPMFLTWAPLMNAIFLIVWSIGKYLYDILLWMFGRLTAIINVAWSAIKAVLSYTLRYATAHLFALQVLWDNVLKGALTATYSLFTKTRNLLLDVFRPVHITLQKVIDLPLAMIVNATISGLAVIPDFFTTLRTMRIVLVNTASKIEDRFFAERQIVASAFGLVRDRLNGLAAWTNLLVVPPGRINIGLLWWALVDYLPWWLHLVIVTGIPDDLDVKQAEIRARFAPLRTPVVAPRLGAGLIPDPAQLANIRATLFRAGGIL